MNHLIIALLCIIALLSGALAHFIVADYKRRRSTPNHARLLAKPGATLDLVGATGEVHAKVLLSSISHRRNEGTSVEFVDYYRYMERTTYRG